MVKLECGRRKIVLAFTLRYSRARSLCSSNICCDNRLFGSGVAGLRCGSNIRYMESRSSEDSISVWFRVLGAAGDEVDVLLELEVVVSAAAVAEPADVLAVRLAAVAVAASLEGSVDLVSVTVNLSFP